MGGHIRRNAEETILQFSERCERLGVFCWVLDETGLPELCSPSAPGCAVLRSELVLRVLSDWAKDIPDHELVEISPGCWLADLNHPRHPIAASRVLAMFVGPKFLDSGVLRAWSGASDVAAVASELEPWARFDQASAAAMASALRMMYADILEAVDSSIAIEGFAVELMDAYEQIRLLYRIGRSMTGGKRPEVFVRELCRELEENTRFAWVAAKFPGEFDPAPGLADKLIRSGSPSCALALFGELVDQTALSVTTGGHQVLKPERDLLARRVGTEVLAHPVTRDSGPIGCLLAGEKSGEDSEISSVDTQLLDAAADFLGVFLDNARLYQRQREIFLGTLQALTASIDAKDPYTRGHSERVAVLAAKLAEKVGMSPDHVERIRITGIVHDVGKIGVPEAVLRKTDRLTDAEFALMKQHPEIGYKILQDVPQFSDVLPGVLHHHERWDGNGYPRGLAGDEIPLDARILAIADAFDAMSSDRSYRPAMTRDNVMAEIRRCTGTQFDPSIAPLFLELDLSVYDRMVREHTVRYQQAA